MPQRIRCRFDVFSSEISGLPADVESVKLVVDHQKVSKRYAASDVLQASEGITQLEDPADTRPLMSFTCHVYPSKEVNLRLMGCSSSRDRPSLLSRGTNWTQLATAVLPIDQLAQQLLLPGVAGGPPTPRASTEVFTRPQISIPSTPQEEEVTSPALSASAPSSPFAAANSFSQIPPAQNLLVEDDDDAGSELFTIDSAAAAVTGRRGAVGTGKKSVGSSKHLGSLGDLRDFENDVNNDDVRKAAQDTADVPPAAGWGLGSTGGYGVEVQSSRLALNWTAAEEGLDLQQQLVVHAHLLQPSRTSMWAQALASPKKAASVASNSSGRHASTASGSGFHRRKWADKLYNSLKPDTPAAGGTGPPPPDSPSVMRDDGSGPPTGGNNSAPAAPHNKHLDQAAAQRVNVHGRLPSFEPWVESDRTTTGTSPQPPTDTSHLPAGHPLNFFGSRGPTATPHNTSAKPPVLDVAPPAAAGPGSPVGNHQQPQQQQVTSPANTDAEDQAAKHEFLQLILATLSSSHSMESDAVLQPPSAAQLAAAASLPRAPAAADLEAFAFATGLPIDKVAEAAATKLGTGSSPTSVPASSNSSAKTSPRSNKAYPADKALGEATAAAAVNGGPKTRAAAPDVAAIAEEEHVPADADALAPEVPRAPVPTPKASTTQQAAAALDLALAEESDVAAPVKTDDLAPATATAQVPGMLDDTASGAAVPEAAGNPAPSTAPAASHSFETAAASPAPQDVAREAPESSTAAASNVPAPAAPESSPVGTSAAAALAAAVSEAVAAAEQGEIVTVVVESVETAAAGPGGEQVAVPVVTVAEAALVPSGTDTAAAANGDASMLAGAADSAGVAADHVGAAAEPTAVVTATAIAVIHDSSSPTAARAEEAGTEGWEPQQLAVATTTIIATPVHANTTEQSGSAAGEGGGTDAADVIVTTTTDVAITSVSDAELADFAAPVAPQGGVAGATGLEELLAPVRPVYRGESLGLGAVGEGSAIQLLQPASRSTSAAAAVEEASRAAAAAKSAAAVATAWAASHTLPADTTDTIAAAAAPAQELGSARAAKGVTGIEQFSPAGPAVDVESAAAAVPAVVVAATVMQPAEVLSEQQLEEHVAPFASEEALDMFVSPPGTETSSSAAPSAVTAGVNELQPVEAAVMVVAPAAAVVMDVIPEQQVEEQLAPFASGEALDMHVASGADTSAAAAASAVTAGVSEIQPAEELLVVVAPGAAAMVAEVGAPAEAPAAVQEFIASHPAASAGLLPGAAAAAAQPVEQEAVIVVQPALLRLQQSGQQLQATPSGTSRLAEVLERISSQPLTPIETVGSAAAETWRSVFSGAPTTVSQQEVTTQGTSSHTSLIALSAMLAAAGSIALAIPAFLFSTLLAALSLVGTTAVRRARARRSSSGGAVSAAQREVLTTAANAAYYGAKRAAATGLEVALYIPRSIALALFNLWMFAATALVVRPGLAMLRYIKSQAQAVPGRVMGQMPAATTAVSQEAVPVAVTAVTAVTAGSTESETSVEESSSSMTEQLQANAAAVGLLSGTTSSPAGGWLMRMRERVSRSPSITSSFVPPTPAPSLEAGQAYSGLMERSWSSMLSLITPLTLSRSPSVSSVAATPPSTPLVTSSDASFTSTTGMSQLDLSPATSATSTTAVVAGPTLGSSSRPLARKSRLGQSTGPGLATIASVTDLAAAAESADETNAAAAVVEGDTAAVEVTTTVTEVTVAPDGIDATAPEGGSSWWWSTVSSTAVPAVTAVYNNSSKSWWPAWMSGSTLLEGAGSSTPDEGQDALPATPAPSVASGWLPGWLQYSRSSSIRSSAGSQSSTAAPDVADCATSPGSLVGDTEVRTSPIHGGTTLDSAVDMAPRTWLGFMTYQSAQWCHMMLQLLMLSFMPVAWYVDAVTSVLRSGVHTTTWLVELAVWWALLPGRLAWWSATLPWKAAHVLLTTVMASSRQSSRQSSSRQPVGATGTQDDSL